MPYGTVTETDGTRPRVNFVNYYPGGSKSYPNVGSGSCPYHAKLSYSRSGTNATVRGTALSTLPGTLKLVAVQVPKGPRLSYKIWSKRLSKYVWARAPITVYKLKRVKTKISVCKGMNLPPNRLNFQSNRVSYFGGDGKGNLSNYAGVLLSNPQYQRQFSGDLWCSFYLPYANSVYVGGNPAPHLSQSMSSRFTTAVSEANSKALTAFYDAAKNQSVNFGQALAERAQTASLVKDCAVRIAKAYTALRKGNLLQAANAVFPTTSKQLANDWLILQYGINPLISDIKGAANMLTEGATFQFDVKKKRRVNLPRILIEESGSASPNGMIFPHHTQVWSEGYVEVTYKARCTVNNAFGRFTSQTGLTNLPSLAWELTPYSFVIDWLIPIGDYLNNQDAFSGLKLEYVTKTVFCKEYITYERRLGGTDNNNYVFPKKTVGFVNERVSCSRSIETMVPNLPYPSFKDPVSAGHIANAIALLRQLKK